MTKIIIDTNIYLNFYRLNSGHSLEMLKNLNKLIADGKFKLVLPRQIEDEFIRNKNSRSAIYGDHILNFQKGLEVQFKIPHLIKSTQKIEQIKRTVKKLQLLKENAVEDYKNRVFNPRSKINQQINQLFSHADRLSETDSILQRSWFRTLRGNPPRKDNSSFGDAIIWETILDQCVDEDLILISGDGDFASEINEEKLHELLSIEWSGKSKKKLSLYTKLGSFINQQSKNKKKPIKEETIQEEDRLNSIFATSYMPTPLAGQGEHKGIVLSESLGINTCSPSYTVSGKSRCICCGAEIDRLSTNNVFGLGKCENCSDSLLPGRTCSKCGKHFHRGITSALSFFSDRCDECQNKL